jgi:hypothetical protein
VAKGHVIAYTDADLPISVDSIIAAIETVYTLDKPGMCVGYRPHLDRSPSGIGNFRRKLASWIYRRYVNLLFPDLPSDPACCLKVFDRATADAIQSQAKQNSYVFDVEACLIASHLGIEVREIAVNWVDKRAKLPLSNLLIQGLEGLWGVAALRYKENRSLLTIYHYRE